MSAKCSSCDASIVWLEMQSSTGVKRHPFDAKPKTGWVTLIDGGDVVVSRLVYTSHFATCPNAEQHRRAPA